MINYAHIDSALRGALADIFNELATELKATSADTVVDASNTPILFRQMQPEDRLTTEWPKLSTEPCEQNLWDTAVTRQSFEPGDVVRLYTAGSSGLANLAQRLQLPLFKIGLTQQSDLLVRQRQLRTDCYGGYVKEAGKFVLEPGFDDWEIRQIDGQNIPNLPLITIAPRCLVIQLPASLSFQQFERKLDEVLSPITLSDWISTKDGKRHLAALPIDPVIADRFTLYDFGSVGRLSHAKELCICRPRDDVPKIARLISRIICDHLAMQPTAPL